MKTSQRATALSRAFVVTMAAGVTLTCWSPTAHASFPGANGSLAFVRNDATATGDVWSTGPDGSSQQQLSDTVYGYDPSWSADGTKLVFSDLGHIWSMNADGSAQTRLTNTTETDRNPTYVPGGRAIVFDRSEPGNVTNLYLLRLTASGQPVGAAVSLTASTEPGTDNRKPVVSPDGSRIAFESDRDGDTEIYVLRGGRESPTNPVRQLTRNTISDFEPDWSPDGRALVFAHGLDVWVMGADGSRQTRITTQPGIEERGPVWSPDGTKIAFQRFDVPGNNYEIFIINAAPESPANPAVNVTRNPADDFTPSWQPLR